MCQLGLIDFWRQTGTVNLHEQNTLSNSRYEELKSARKMIEKAIQDSSLKVDIYDGNCAPKDKFVYAQVPDCVFVEVTDLLSDKVKSEEFFDQSNKEPVLRRLFRFIDKVTNVEEPPIERMKKMTMIRYNHYLSNLNKMAQKAKIV